MKSTNIRKNRLSLYETALWLAMTKARQDELRWERFIDDLSQICDMFASEIATEDAAPSKRENPS